MFIAGLWACGLIPNSATCKKECVIQEFMLFVIQSIIACGLYVKYDSACFRVCSLLACGLVG
jgi:hypothetical protein